LQRAFLSDRNFFITVRHESFPEEQRQRGALTIDRVRIPANPPHPALIATTPSPA
jgi:hypothetical protein